MLVCHVQAAKLWNFWQFLHFLYNFRLTSKSILGEESMVTPIFLFHFPVRHKHMEMPTNSGSLLIENNFWWDLCMFLQQNGVTVANLLNGAMIGRP